MNRRLTIILVVVFALLGGYYYFAEMQEKTDEEEEATQDVVMEVSPDNITVLEVRRGSDKTRLARDAEGEWTMESPGFGDVNTTTVTSLLNSFYPMRYTRALTEVNDLAEYGLATPGMTVKVLGGDKQYAIFVGDETPDESGAYIRMGDDRKTVYIIYSDIVDGWNGLIDDPPFPPTPTPIPPPEEATEEPES